MSTTTEGEVVTEAVTQDGASEGDPGTGTPAEGASATATPPTDGGDAFAEERARMQAQIRALQSDRDRERARIQALEKQGAGSPAQETTERFLTRDEFRAELRRQREFDSTVSALRSEYELADGSIFDRVDSFDSLEQLREAAASSHQRVKDLLEPALKAEREQIEAQYRERFGPLNVPPPGGTEGTPDGLPTFEQVARMSLDERDALDRQHPGLVTRLLDERMAAQASA
jgi:hypothetical protein